jgi:hypothetical protein
MTTSRDETCCERSNGEREGNVDEDRVLVVEDVSE